MMAKVPNQPSDLKGSVNTAPIPGMANTVQQPVA
jgi:hypothetical protein